MVAPRGERRHDVILFGATGYTGRLVADYLTTRAAGGALRWALAGRSRVRLEHVRDQLAVIDAAAAELPLIEADAHDPDAMARVAEQTRVVCTTVGPYLRYGAELVAACARAGTDYCDLTGEPPFVRQTIDRHHDEARTSGARIVPCCGYDSIPSDLGTLYLQDQLAARTGATARTVHGLFGETRGAPSGASVQTLLDIVDAAARDPALRRQLLDPHALDPPGGPRGSARDPHGPGYDRVLGLFTAPFVMAAINARIVRRSHALLGYPWGDDFAYDERMSLPRSPGGLAAALAVSGGMLGVVAASQIRPLRRRIEARLPRPGEGPTAEQRARGRFVVRLHGEAGGQTLIARVAADLDPGYGATARMLGEAALCLARDDEPGEGGVLTPATALGLRLIDPLRAAGIDFDVDVAPT